MNGIDMQNDNLNQEYPDSARVFIIDGVEMGPAIIMVSVGAELPELLIAAYKQLETQEQPLTVGFLSVALVFQAAATGNQTSLHSAPLNSSYPMQLNGLFIAENAFGGIGTVLIDVSTGEVTTYGGIGFPEVAPSNLYQPCTFPFSDLANMPLSGRAPARKPGKERNTAKKKAAAKAKTAASRKKAAAKKKAKSTANVTV